MSQLQIGWAEMVIPTHSIAEMVVRGTVMYLFLFAVFRVFLKRQVGAIGIADLLLVVIIADAAQNAFSKEYKSITEGIVLIATIAAWDYALDWLGYRFEWFGRLLHPKPLPLVRNGRMLKRNMEKESISEDELLSHLREKGVENVADVKSAFIEGDGRMSVIKKEPSK